MVGKNQKSEFFVLVEMKIRNNTTNSKTGFAKNVCKLRNAVGKVDSPECPKLLVAWDTNFLVS
jgi:hypothetical protein